MDLFGDQEDGHFIRPEDDRCSPEKLEAFIRRTIAVVRRFPTLKEIKHEFGGILGAYVDAWELQRRGVWKELLRLTRKEG